MTRSIRVGRVKDGTVSGTTYNWTPNGTSFHREVQGQDTGEVHIPASQLTDAQKRNPEGTFRPNFSFIIATDTNSAPNPIVFGGVISKVQPRWGAGELVLILDGMWRILDLIPAIPISSRFGNDDIRTAWELSGDTFQQAVNHMLDTATTETSDGLKFAQCWGSLPWSAGDVKFKIPLTNPPMSIWGKLEELRNGPSAIETVIIPEFTDSSQNKVRFVLHVQSKSQPYYNKDEDLGEVDLSAGSRGAIDFDYINDATQQTASWQFGSSQASKKGDDNYTDLTAKIKPAPDNDYFFHTFSGEQYDSDLTADELNEQISARVKDASTEYKSYTYKVFDSSFSYLKHLGKTLTIVDSQRLDGLSETMRITGISWDFDDPSSVTIDVLPKDLTVFPRVPQHPDDFGGDTKNHNAPHVTKPKPIEPKATAPAFVTDDPLPDGTVGVPYFASIRATGFPTPEITLGGASLMPAGLEISSTGLITGTPTQSYENYEITLQAKNKKDKDVKLYHITIKAGTEGPVTPGDIVRGTSVVGIPGTFGAYDPTTWKVINGGEIGGGSEILMMDTSGQMNDIYGIGTPFLPITLKSLSFDNNGNMVNANEAKGVLPGSFLDALITGQNVAVNQPAGDSGEGRLSEQLRYSMILSQGRVYIWFLACVTLGNKSDGQSQVFYRNAMIMGTIQSNGLIGNWVWCNTPVVQDGRYPEINTAKFWAPTSSIETYGEHDDHIFISTPTLFRDTGYSGYYSIAQKTVSPSIPLAIVGTMVDTITYNWGVGSQIPWKKYTGMNPPRVSWAGDKDFADYAPTMTHKGADGYLYVVNNEYGGYTPNAMNSIPGYHVGGNPNGVSIWRTNGRVPVLGAWEQVVEDQYTHYDDSRGENKGSNYTGVYHPLGVTATGLFYLNGEYGRIGGVDTGTIGSLRSIPYSSVGGAPKQTAADPLAKVDPALDTATSSVHVNGSDAQIKPSGFTYAHPFVYPLGDGIRRPNPGQFQSPVQYWRVSPIQQTLAYIGDAGPALCVLKAGKWLVYARGGGAISAGRDETSWLMRIQIS